MTTLGVIKQGQADGHVHEHGSIALSSAPMPIEGIPDPQIHRICRRCGKWFEPEEGALVAPDGPGPLGAMRAVRAAFDPSVMRFQCNRCTWVRRTRERVLWGALFAFMAAVLLLEKLGWIH